MGESKSIRSYNVNVFKKINHYFLYSKEIVFMFCTIVLVIAVFIQVVCRYILLISIPWTEELIWYLFAWMAYPGEGYALYTGGQIEVDIAPTIIKSLKGISVATKDRVILLLETVGLVITVVFLLGLYWVSGNYIMFITGGSQASQIIRILMRIVYFPVLTGSLIAVWYGVYRILYNIWPVSANTEWRERNKI